MNCIGAKECIYPDSTMSFQVRRDPVKPFIPKESNMTSKERMLWNLKTGDIKETTRLPSSLENRSQEPLYPLSKMVHAASPPTHAPRLPCQFRPEDEFPPHHELIAKDTLASRDIKKLYNDRHYARFPVHIKSKGSSVDSSQHHTPVSQKEFIHALLKRREENPDYSDIFGLKAETFEDNVQNPREHNVASKRYGRVFFLDSERKKNDLCLRHQDESPDRALNARQRQPDTLKNESHGPRLHKPFTTPLTNSLDATQQSDIFGQVKPYKNKDIFVANVAMIRLHHIPHDMTESDIMKGIRSCHCYVTKFWCPRDLILGHHKGWGSIIVRESQRFHDPTNNNATVAQHVDDPQGLPCDEEPKEPFSQLQTWFTQHGIQATIEEVCKE